MKEMKISLNVKGMHCRSCEMLVKDAVGGLPGVSQVEASAGKGIVTVVFDESKTRRPAIVAAIRNEGYEVSE